MMQLVWFRLICGVSMLVKCVVLLVMIFQVMLCVFSCVSSFGMLLKRLLWVVMLVWQWFRKSMCKFLYFVLFGWMFSVVLMSLWVLVEVIGCKFLQGVFFRFFCWCRQLVVVVRLGVVLVSVLLRLNRIVWGGWSGMGFRMVGRKVLQWVAVVRGMSW